jgi:predicted phage tail component-like protein
MTKMIFDGKDITQYVRVKDIRRDLIPPMESEAQDIPGRPGSVVAKTNIKDRLLEVDVRIEVNSRPELRQKIRELAGLLYTDEKKKLQFTDENVFYMAKIDGETGIEESSIFGDITLTFLCDPLLYGGVKTLSLGETLRNGGTYPTTGIITVTMGAADFLKVTLKSTGEYVYIEHNFVSGDTVAIDLETEMVYKNGLSISKDVYLESDFFMIPKGDFEITLSSGSGMVEFTERWL